MTAVDHAANVVAPAEASREPGSAVRRRRRRRMLLGEILRDPYTLYTAGLVPIALVVSALDGYSAGWTALAVLVPIFVGLQVALGIAPPRYRPLTPMGWSFLRLSVSLLFVAAMVPVIGGPSVPLVALYLPVVVGAAAVGTAQAVVIGAVASAIFLVPHFTWGGGGDLGIRGIVLGGAGILLAIGTRRLVVALENASGEVRSAMVGERRRSRQIAGMEHVGQMLVSGELSDELLDRTLGEVSQRFGYQEVSLWLADGDGVTLAAQRGYGVLPTTFDASHGVMGRAIRSQELVFVPDVARDPDYISGLPEIVSEICAPLIVGGQFLGIFNVEARHVLDKIDCDVVAALAERMATAVALGRERQALGERAAALSSLIAFTESIGSSLQLEHLAQTVMDGTQRVVDCDLVVLTTLDRESGRYLIRAERGLDLPIVGAEIKPGEGVSGRAIRDRALVFGENIGSAQAPAAVVEQAQAHGSLETFGHIAAVPLVRDRVVVGALAIGRRDAARPFRPIEREAIELLAGQIGLALANAFLHTEVEELAIRDGLTGLYNRRYFDEALDRLLASWRRVPPIRRLPIGIITFDLDHFGTFNKQHGHQVGDAVLKMFATLLATRFRANDLVARLGGEEFVVVLDGSGRADAVRIAEEVRTDLAKRSVPSESGEELKVSVSAGCAEVDPEVPTREQLLRTADVALFMAKRGGRDQVVAA